MAQLAGCPEGWCVALVHRTVGIAPSCPVMTFFVISRVGGCPILCRSCPPRTYPPDGRDRSLLSRDRVRCACSLDGMGLAPRRFLVESRCRSLRLRSAPRAATPRTTDCPARPRATHRHGPLAWAYLHKTAIHRYLSHAPLSVPGQGWIMVRGPRLEVQACQCVAVGSEGNRP